jgi:ABC-2 type transport system permease protein
VVSTPTAKAVNFFVPGILALAVMSTAMVSLGIATGFERGYGVLKRLGATPLGRPRCSAPRSPPSWRSSSSRPPCWSPSARPRLEPGRHGGPAGAPSAVVLLATAAFAGIGLFMAGVLKAEVNLAAANGLYLVLLLLGGMVVPISKLPSGVASVAKLLPADALSAALHAALGTGRGRADRVLGGAGRLGRGRPAGGRSASAGNELLLVGGELGEGERAPRRWR